MCIINLDPGNHQRREARNVTDTVHLLASALNAALSGFVFEAEAERSKPGSPRGQQVCAEPPLPSPVCKCFHRSLSFYFRSGVHRQEVYRFLPRVRILGGGGLTCFFFAWRHVTQNHDARGKMETSQASHYVAHACIVTI